jgi:two-component system, OmpR family, response regulator TctD
MRILLVEDHVDLSRWLAKALRATHFTVECAFNGADADGLLATENYSLVILDLMLPKMEGLEVLKRLRARGSKVPVLILTARGEVADRVRGLNLGADDYMAKPFDLAELEARVKTLLRRTQGDERVVITCGRLTFDTISRMFHWDNRLLNLTPREHAVLEAFISRAGKAIGKNQLFEKIFSIDDDASPDAIEIYVHRLRKKLEDTDVKITTLRGLGYVLEVRSD